MLWSVLKDTYSTLWPQLVCSSFNQMVHYLKIRPQAAFVKIKVRCPLRNPDKERDKAKAAALKFLKQHPNASVIIFLDGKIDQYYGTLIYYGTESAPLSIVSFTTHPLWGDTKPEIQVPSTHTWHNSVDRNQPEKRSL